MSSNGVVIIEWRSYGSYDFGVIAGVSCLGGDGNIGSSNYTFATIQFTIIIVDIYLIIILIKE